MVPRLLFKCLLCFTHPRGEPTFAIACFLRVQCGDAEELGNTVPRSSPKYPDAFYDDIIEERNSSPYAEEDADETRLVRSASIGKRAKPTLVGATAPRMPEPPDGGQFRPGPSPVQGGPFQEGTGYLEESSSSSTLPRKPAQAVTADSMLSAMAAASSSDPSSSRATPEPGLPGGRPYSRLSAIRRPPRLDVDPANKAGSRASLTSLARPHSASDEACGKSRKGPSTRQPSRRSQ